VDVVLDCETYRILPVMSKRTIVNRTREGGGVGGTCVCGTATCKLAVEQSLTRTDLAKIPNSRVKITALFIHSFIHLFIYFDSGSMAHKDNRQIRIDNKRKTKLHNNRHTVDKRKRTDRDNKNDQVLMTLITKRGSYATLVKLTLSSLSTY